MQLKATKNLWYGGQSYFAGQVFEAAEKDAFILKGINKAVDADDGSYFTGALEHDGAKQKRRKRRTYKRRDMVAS